MKTIYVCKDTSCKKQFATSEVARSHTKDRGPFHSIGTIKVSEEHYSRLLEAEVKDEKRKSDARWARLKASRYEAEPVEEDHGPEFG